MVFVLKEDKSNNMTLSGDFCQPDPQSHHNQKKNSVVTHPDKGRSKMSNKMSSDSEISLEAYQYWANFVVVSYQ